MLCDRLTAWARREKVLSWEQKGFLPFEGCSEHNFVLQDVLQDAPHSLRGILGPRLRVSICALQAAGLSPAEIELVRHLYTDTTTKVRHSAGETAPITL